jgi:uncharacterized protein (TIGR00369 family)
MAFDPAASGWTRYDDPALPRVTEGHWRREEGAGFAFGFETGPAQHNGNGVVHGGILATCMDHTMGRVARNAAEAKVATIQLDLHYLAPAIPGQFLEVRGEVVRRTRSVIFLRGLLTAEGKPLLSATGIWKVLGAP